MTSKVKRKRKNQKIEKRKRNGTPRLFIGLERIKKKLEKIKFFNNPTSSNKNF